MIDGNEKRNSWLNLELQSPHMLLKGTLIDGQSNGNVKMVLTSKIISILFSQDYLT